MESRGWKYLRHPSPADFRRGLWTARVVESCQIGIIRPFYGGFVEVAVSPSRRTVSPLPTGFSKYPAVVNNQSVARYITSAGIQYLQRIHCHGKRYVEPLSALEVFTHPIRGRSEIGRAHV